jgi:hypothetical protein
MTLPTLALIKSLVQRLNERSLGGHVNASYYAEVEARKVALPASPISGCLPVETGPESGTTSVYFHTAGEGGLGSTLQEATTKNKIQK